MTQHETNGTSEVILAEGASPEFKIVFFLFYDFNYLGESVLWLG
jgi:hypothetical protein